MTSYNLKKNKDARHVYIIGSKSIGMYGGYESFVMNLLQNHKDNENILYHIACKANGSGYMDISKLENANMISEDEFIYCNHHCFLIKVPEKLGSFQAIYYDINALKYVVNHIRQNDIKNPIVYILASRIGIFEKRFVKAIHEAGGKVFHNPDGHEFLRRKWPFLIRKYWKISERFAIKNADLIICDSREIQKYIESEYKSYHPLTTFIAYGANTNKDFNSDIEEEYRLWLKKNNIENPFYIYVGRFVEENNLEIMIREFLKSKVKKDFVIVTTKNDKLYKKLNKKYHFERDKRIKFVGTIYNTSLLYKIRQEAFAYFHGHEVGGTNPSLLESLGTTKLNLLLDVKFNREVAKDTAYYWNKKKGSLSKLIEKLETLNFETILYFSNKAKQRIIDEYSWDKICKKYEEVFLGSEN